MNRTVRRCRIAGRRSDLTRSASRAAVASSSTGRVPSTAAYSMPGHDVSERSYDKGRFVRTGKGIDLVELQSRATA